MSQTSGATLFHLNRSLDGMTFKKVLADAGGIRNLLIRPTVKTGRTFAWFSQIGYPWGK